MKSRTVRPHRDEPVDGNELPIPLGGNFHVRREGDHIVSERSPRFAPTLRQWTRQSLIATGLSAEAANIALDLVANNPTATVGEHRHHLVRTLYKYYTGDDYRDVA